ncbi:MAG: 16S rRNA (guanine(966)-N(2))-methyltransferase RsmD [Verrucomicrobiales bacterium]|nr:16S rRNA (guanine(966)-N(2))-methyltransferase RsmD [Verrucomicrobiales bacterium]
MRIIAGQAGSLRLSVPPSLTRPTTDRVREAVFSSLGTKVEESRVLDLFAGSGSLGIESLSRGAASAVFVDNNAAAEKAILANLRQSRLEGARFVRRDVISYLSSAPTDTFDLIFADPPYARDEETGELLATLLQKESLSASLKPDGILVLESFAKSPLPEAPLWETVKEKVYGKTRVSYLTPTV